jgi:RNA polymerase sigma factor (TIGR02999 family)
MPPGAPPRITELLNAWSGGDRAALDRLVPVVYDELRRVARRARRGEAPGHSLQTTGLIHEVYLKILGSKPMKWENRAHFFAMAAHLMRQILVDHARRRRSRKRGGDATRVTLDEALAVSPSPSPDLVTLDRALRALSAVDERKGRVVELRFFGGLGVAETAHVLQVSPQTVKRDWKLAKVWLYREMRGEARPGGTASTTA